jgi:hypothetical protein
MRKVGIQFNGAQCAGTSAKWLVMREVPVLLGTGGRYLPAKANGLSYLSGSENTYNALPFPG